MDARHKLLGFQTSVIVGIVLFAATHGSRARDVGATLQDGGEARVTRHVANNGVDTRDCGGRQTPCRSISQGIVNSTAGDLVLVRPGLYGDLDGSCTLEEVPGEGEEFGGPGCETPRGICLNKEVTVASVAGAEATVIDACAVAFAVVILASNSRFGLPHHGFTLVNATSASVAVALGKNVSVSDNISRVADRASSGFQIESGEDVRVIGNLARDGNNGFSVSRDAKRVEIADNAAVSNEFGFQLSAADPVVLRQNVAIGNGMGFVLFGGSHVLRRNSIIGNRHYGISINGSSPPLINDNNIFGNNNVPVPEEGSINCGILNAGTLNVNATNNFWGAPTGPGVDPADEACNLGRGQIVHTPFATKEFRLRPKWHLRQVTPEGI